MKGRQLCAHVGIASGEVVAGVLGRAGAEDYTVLGDSVNLAARLVAAAGTGETLVSEGVVLALGGRGVSEPKGAMRFKGIAEPVSVYKLHAMADDSARRGPLVGRKNEVAQFAEMVQAALDRRRGQLMHLRGEAGIGKTRLLEEMQRLAELAGFRTHRALVLDFGVAKGLEAAGVLVKSLLGLARGADTDQRLEAARRVVDEGVIAEEHHPVLYDWLQVPIDGRLRALLDATDHAALGRSRREILRGLAAAAGAREPTLVVVEDLHWADPETMEQLAAVAAALAGGPGVLAVTSRVEGDPLDAAWRAAAGDLPYTSFELRALERADALRLAESFGGADDDVALACVERAGGNPLFLEHLLRNAQHGAHGAIPGSIQSVVLARMDTFAPLDRRALQVASIMGQRVDVSLLQALVGEPGYGCERLVQHAVLVPEGDGYLFAHALIQEGVYASILKAHRRELHVLAADWYAAKDATLRAQHLDRAQDDRAPRAYLEAAASERAAHRAQAAKRLCSRGLELVVADDERQSLLCLLGEIHRDLADVPASIATYREALASATDAAASCRAQIGLAEGLRVVEGLDEALALLDAAEARATEADLVAELARTHHLRGNIYFGMGNIQGCRKEHEKGIVDAKRSGSVEAEARALGGLGDAAYAQGRIRDAFEHFQRCVEISRAHGLGRIEVANRPMVGVNRIYLGQPREAFEEGVAAARDAALVRQPRAEMLGETLCVFSAYELGAFDAMEGHLRAELALARQLGARRFEAQSRELAGRRLGALGRRKEAEADLREVLALCESTGMRFCGPKVLSALSLVVEDAAEQDALLARGEALLAQGSVAHNHLWFYRDAMEVMLLRGSHGDADRYADRLDAYTRPDPFVWSQLFVDRARALARAGSGERSDAVRASLLDVQRRLVQTGLLAMLGAVEAALAE